MVDGSTGFCLAFAAFWSVLDMSEEVAGAACARQRLDATASSTARVKILSFEDLRLAILKRSLLKVNLDS
jgi:hypothetical protein